MHIHAKSSPVVRSLVLIAMKPGAEQFARDFESLTGF